MLGAKRVLGFCSAGEGAYRGGRGGDRAQCGEV